MKLLRTYLNSLEKALVDFHTTNRGDQHKQELYRSVTHKRTRLLTLVNDRMRVLEFLVEEGKDIGRIILENQPVGATLFYFNQDEGGIFYYKDQGMQHWNSKGGWGFTSDPQFHRDDTDQLYSLKELSDVLKKPQ